MKWIRRGIEELKKDIRSKLIDGLGAAFLILLVNIALPMLARPIEYLSGLPGQFIYVVGLLGISVFLLDHSLNNRIGEDRQAWSGILGGLMAWGVLEIGQQITHISLANLNSFLSLIMVGLITTALWRHGIHLGARFYALTILLNWGAQILLNSQLAIGQTFPYFASIYWINGAAAAVGELSSLIWIFCWTERRIQRLWGALWVWIFAAVAIMVFRGGLF